jgi:hypothetical protein
MYASFWGRCEGFLRLKNHEIALQIYILPDLAFVLLRRNEIQPGRINTFYYSDCLNALCPTAESANQLAPKIF